MNIILLKAIGLIGGSCFAYAAVPASIKTIKAGKSIGTPITIAWLIFWGTVFMYGYLFFSYGFDIVITLNYLVEALSWLVIIKYHYLPTKNL